MSVMSDQNGPNAGQGSGAGGARDGSRDSGSGNDKDKNKRDMDSWSRHYQSMGEAAAKGLGNYTGRTPDGATTPESQSKKTSWGGLFKSALKLFGSLPGSFMGDPLSLYGTYKGVKGLTDSLPGSVYPADERSMLNGKVPGTTQQDGAGDGSKGITASVQKQATTTSKPKAVAAIKPFDMFTSAPRTPEGYDSTILGGGLSTPRPKKKLLGE